MSADESDHEHEDEYVPDMSRWSDAEFHRAAALMAWEAEQEDDEGVVRAPDYDR